MGWYRVIKTVNGRRYAYMQRSFRDGEKVRTESRYIGAIDPNETEKPAHNTAPEPQNPPARQTVTVRAREKLRTRFVPERRGLSSERLKREYAKTLEWAQGLGVSPDTFPRIVLRMGSKTRSRRAWRGNGLVVSVERSCGRKAIRRAFGDGLGRAFLDGVREANPRAYAVIADTMGDSFQTTNFLFFRALSQKKELSRVALSLQIGFFGQIHPVRGVRAESVGLSAYGKRGGWEDETAGIIGEIATQGFLHVLHARSRATAKAYEAEHKARIAYERADLFDRITGKRRALGRELVGKTSARMATEEVQRKLRLLARILPEIEK